MAVWYCNFGNGTSSGYYAVAQWAAATAYNVGDLRRQLATPTVGNERVFRCTTAGTSGGAEPTWTLTKGSVTNDNTAVWTEVTGDSTYGWSAPHARLAIALAWSAAGDTIYLSNAHAETQASAMTLTSPGTAASITKVICVNDAAEPPTALAVTATVTTTGGSAIYLYGFAYYYGITFSSATGSNNIACQIGSPYASSGLVMDNCVLALGSTHTGSRLLFGGTGSTTYHGYVKLINTSFKFASTSQGIGTIACDLEWVNSTAVTGATVPTSLFLLNSSSPGRMHANNVDFSALGSGKNIVASTAGNTLLSFANCKLGTSVTPLTGTISGQGGQVLFDNCDSGDTNYRMEHYKYQGSIKNETTVVRTGGASDGTTTISWNMTTTSGATYVSPLESPVISTWNETLSSITVTVEITQLDADTVVTDAECWLEISYLGTSGGPLGSTVSSQGGTVLAPGTGVLPQGSNTWPATHDANRKYLRVTIVPAERGYIQARVIVAKASATVYVDPKLTVA